MFITISILISYRKDSIEQEKGNPRLKYNLTDQQTSLFFFHWITQNTKLTITNRTDLLCFLLLCLKGRSRPLRLAACLGGFGGVGVEHPPPKCSKRSCKISSSSISNDLFLKTFKNIKILYIYGLTSELTIYTDLL